MNGERNEYVPISIDDNTPDIVLSLVVLIILIVFLGWMTYLLISSGFHRTSPGDPVSSDARTNINITCAPGQCATDLFNGAKRCPVGEIPITIDPSHQVCNSRFVCDNPLTPFALQSDQSTNINGVCEPFTECSCLKVSQCANYILSVFTTSNGNPYQTLNGQRITFPQISTYVAAAGGQTDTPPIRFNNPATTFCSAPLSWMPLSNPGCNFIGTTDPNSITYEDLLLCMGMVNGCSGLQGSPCLQGTLAFLSSNPDTLTQNSIYTTQLACVRGEPCPCDQVAIFDTSYGGIVCRSLPQ